jgi:hypothetical protein
VLPAGKLALDAAPPEALDAMRALALYVHGRPAVSDERAQADDAPGPSGQRPAGARAVADAPPVVKVGLWRTGICPRSYDVAVWCCRGEEMRGLGAARVWCWAYGVL